jgi:cysteine sulfinate desulfinase/cysteine desulfurase-like protein
MAMKPESAESRQMIRFSLDAERSAAITKKVLANLEEAVVALHI